ncbi:Ribosomal silencing factor during starvation-like protein [Elsinoe fawcettii]|nr:Ribosomal silencing factor during starvation-like protein [Elsinoe fawcettii]
MAGRHICGSSLGAITHPGYLIRGYVAASRAEVRPARRPWKTAQISRLRPVHLATPVRSFASKANDDFGDSPFDIDSQYDRDASEQRQDDLAYEESVAAATHVPSDIPPETVASGSTTLPPTDPSLPWYLQPSISPSPTHAQATQPLPDLPPSPPSLLSPLLTHLSLELGQDDLSLLDLRSLDPPAALGSNLIMILATSRSEKHLHVSADRLCRWLRTEHGMRPFADGLLGRNELKLRMKRKAKRSRLLSAVGAKATGAGDVDDGIRTGWVCVNLGEVEGGVLPKEEGEGHEDGFVGFRTEAKGCRVVVQMMTDERRGALDLESLWTGLLNRSKNVEAAEDESLVTETLQKRKQTQSPFPEAQTTTIVERSQTASMEARA